MQAALTSPTPFKYAVLASGGGSNFQALLDHSGTDQASAGHLPAQAVFTASNNSGSRALERARAAGIPAYHVSTRTEGSEEAVADRLTALLDEYKPDVLVLAGYMKKVPDAVLARMKNRVVNIHPALLPDFGGEGFYGEKVHEAVVGQGRAFSGMTIHMVNGEYDKGQVVLQRRTPVPPGADAAEVGRRVLALEHDSFWRVLRGFAEGDIVATESDDPARAVRVSPEWAARMRALEGTVFP